MAAYNTLNGNTEKIQQIIEVLEREKGNWSNVIYTDAAIKSFINDKLEDIISDLKDFKINCETNGSQMNTNAKWE